MASDAPPPPYNPVQPDPNFPPSDPPPPTLESYPGQAPYPPDAPPSYSSQDQSKAYPVQSGPYPQQGVPPGYSQPGYGPTPGAAPGYTTQTVGYYPQARTNQTTVITQQPVGGIIIHNTAPPPDFMLVSIISMFCCFFIGIFALLRSMRSRDLYRAGDVAGAQQMGLRARKLAHIAILVAICTYVAVIILRIVLSIALNG